MVSRGDAIPRSPLGNGESPSAPAVFTPAPPEFCAAYKAALLAYLCGAGESGLMRAWELGRRALRERVGLLEVTALHGSVVADVLARDDERCIVQRLAAVNAFLLEALAPFAMAQRGFDEATVALREINQHLENELRRIAHSLHDEVQQLLVTVYIALEEIRDALPADKAAPLSKVLRQVDGIAEHVRSISHELRPTILDDLGLVAALELLAEGVSRRHGLQVTVAGSAGGRLKPGIEIALYRIAQEGLNNVVRHARAHRARICLDRAVSELSFSLSDDGVGFEVGAVLNRAGRQGLGLLGIHERVDALGGKLHLESRPGNGTVLSLTVPLGLSSGAGDADARPAC